MKTNIGSLDRVLRIALALVCSVLYFTGVASGVWGAVALVVGGAMLVTAAVGWCGLYQLTGINTCKAK
ncbi:MAG: DUF2892 domain-containing protein [Flavobacteriales bacterium]|nr:DUF2892 domain-containing protein [Flavobacteriales bacterium]